MKTILFVFGVLFVLKTPILAAPSIEDCPPDSVIFEDNCKCDLSTCSKPPCFSQLQLATNGTGLPGQCCPTYECIGCNETEKINGKCPCGKGAVINGYKCECVDKEKHLVNGECVCDPRLCPLPILCDKKSVPVVHTEGCCKITECTKCPADSESTNVEGDEIEDHCVCLPCKTECGFNRTPVIKRPGKGIPGKCCDLYECKQNEEIKGCIHENTIYENGEQWFIPPLQLCRCDNGLALCSNQKEKDSASCFVDNQFHNHSETWTKDEGCTLCTCINGIEKCISHYCDVKVNLVHRNNSCNSSDNVSRLHLEKWIERDNCTTCLCDNGLIDCNRELCEDSIPTTTSIAECQPLANCNKTCINGYRINRKGCEICKCNSVKLQQDILTRYNISMNDLIKILDEYKTKRLPTTIPTTSSTVSTSTSSATVDKSVEIDHDIAPVVISNRNAEFYEGYPTTTTTEPSVTRTDKENDSLIYIVIIVLCSLLFVTVLVILLVFLCKNRRKSSLDLSQCHYHTVNNNNTIKKTDQLL
ncbi:cysteine-rich motor neuron 1 protein [Diorhabda carinulata]|uniref:cysteine-rich motor neuron 1 protein n=1 Tax=Diorhabda carinulata TaxID=1163345 RepID=UPI0025A03A51|nr:cysteine-rich motor neuron 1 protein [Diorhabda carinulata]